MELPMELVSEIIMMQRKTYPWTHKEINKASLLRELTTWANSWDNEQFFINIGVTINDYIETIERDTSEMDEEDLYIHRWDVIHSWDEFMECIKDDYKPLKLVDYKPLDEKFLKSLRFYWHHRYH